MHTHIGDESTKCTTKTITPVTSRKCNDGLNCLFANARSLHSKMGEVEALVNEENYDIIGIAETWLCSSHDWAVNIPGYALFRRDRAQRKGGGVCLYVRSDIKVSMKEDLVDGECDDAEVLWVELYTGTHNTKVIVGVCYRPPGVNEEVETQLFKQIEMAAKAGTVVLMGDFNYPDIDWKNGTAGTTKGRTFINLLHDNFMVQFVDTPTRKDALLDLVISNQAELVTNIHIKEHLGNSDHNMISFNLSVKQHAHTGKTKTLNFRRANFPMLRAALQHIDWEGMFAQKNTEQKWESFKSVVHTHTEQYIPVSNKFKRLKVKPMWLTSSVKKAIKNKKRAFKIYKDEGTLSSFENYKEYNKICKKEIRIAKILNEQKVAKECKTNPKKFFKYINSKKKNPV